MWLGSPSRRSPPPPNKAGGCWKELPKTLAKKKAICNPQNEDHRCFMWCVLAHCLGQQQPARQTVAASSCYVAVGRCGYVPPEELRLRLTHHERDSDKYHAVRSMLNDLLKLADHYLT